MGGGSGAEGVSRIGIDLFARAITCVIVEVGVRLAEVGDILVGEYVLMGLWTSGVSQADKFSGTFICRYKVCLIINVTFYQHTFYFCLAQKL